MELDIKEYIQENGFVRSTIISPSFLKGVYRIYSDMHGNYFIENTHSGKMIYDGSLFNKAHQENTIIHFIRKVNEK